MHMRLLSRCLVMALHSTIVSSQFRRNLSENPEVSRVTENVGGVLDFDLVGTPFES
jgi:hypothetical protein